MANTKASGGRTSSKERQRELQRQELKRRIIILAVTSVAGIFLFLANFGIIGTVGDAVSGFFFGLFGTLWYILPLVVIFETFFVLTRPYSRAKTFQIAGSVLLYFGLAFIVALVQSKSAEKVPFGECYALGLNDCKGGLLALWPASFFVSLLGKVGTWIFSFILVLAGAGAIIGFSNLSDMADGIKSWADSDERRERLEYRRQMREAQQAIDDDRRSYERMQRLEEKQEKARTPRFENKVFGVEFSGTDLKGSQASGDEVVPKDIVRSGESPVAQEGPGKKQPVPIKDTDDLQEVTEESFFTRRRPEAEYHDALDAEGLSLDEAYDMAPVSKRSVTPVNFGGGIPNNAIKNDNDGITYESPEEKFIRERQERMKAERFESELAGDVRDMMEPAPAPIAPINSPDKPAPAPEKPAPAPKSSEYKYPTADLLNKPKAKTGKSDDSELSETAEKLENTLRNFGVDARVTDVTRGPSVTRFEIEPAVGVKVSKIVNLSDDIKLNLAASDIRIEAPIPGKSAVGIEVPNKESTPVTFREMVECSQFKAEKSKIAFGAGRDIAGTPIISDIAKMPHLLIAGATGSGKSVCINTIIMSILFRARPDEVKLIMIDPKVVELSVYNGIPHLMLPVVTDPKKAAAVLQSAVVEMTKRYNLFAEKGVRDLSGYNEAMALDNVAPLPQIVIIVDELADLMMVASKEVEESICRLAQLARACGMHLIIATQRPSVNVITGLIKANMPSRIAFAVTSGIDSRTILDMYGAEKLLGKGDMLYSPQNLNKPLRAQGSFVSDDEVKRVVDFLKQNNELVEADEEMTRMVEEAQSKGGLADGGSGGDIADDIDPYLAEAGHLIIEKERASIGFLQRNFKIGFNRAARIMDQLCENGVVGPEEGTKPRQLLMTLDEFDAFVESKQLK